MEAPVYNGVESIDPFLRAGRFLVTVPRPDALESVAGRVRELAATHSPPLEAQVALLSPGLLEVRAVPAAAGEGGWRPWGRR